MKIMKPDELAGTFQSLVADYIVTWAKCLYNPLATLDKIFAEPDGQIRFKQSLNIWAVSFSLSIFFQLPVLYTVGLSLENVDFQLSYFLSSSFIFVASFLAIHCGLRLMRLQPNLGEIGTLFTVVIAPYQPLFQLSSLSTTAALLKSLQRFKGVGAEYQFNTPIIAMYTSLPVNNLFSQVLGVVTFFVSLVAFGLFVQCVAGRLHTAKYSVINACGLGMALGLIVIAPLAVELQTYIYFAFIRAVR
jgi:hypothetical protein